MPNPPTLQRAIAKGHVGVIDGPGGRFYVISKECPNSDQVRRAIALRNKFELTWIGAVGIAAVVGIAWLAEWSNTV
jgi:hypothetical protein